MYSNMGAMAHPTYAKRGKKDNNSGKDVAGGAGSAKEKDSREEISKERLHHHHHHQETFATRLYNYIRRRINPPPDEELDELSVHVVRHRPEELAKLIKTTKFTRKEIQLIYRGFKQECPTGMVDEESFKHIFAQFFPQGDATHYAHYVFNTIKHNQTGKISFEDFLEILSKVSRGSVQEKLQWIFGLYDINGDGLITKAEMLDVVTSIYAMLGRHTEPQVEENSAKEHVEKLFSQIDLNQDGVVTIDELVQWCLRDERILQSLETLDTVL